jgi:tol-pal system protein YbgF
MSRQAVITTGSRRLRAAGIPAARAAEAAAGRGRPVGGQRLLALLAAVALASLLAGCYAPEIVYIRSGLDSLRTVVDTLVVRDSIAYAVLLETRKELASQRDMMFSSRASSGSTTQEVYDQMGRLESKLNDVMGRFQQATQHAAEPAQPSGPDLNQLYDQAAQDLTQGRYSMALREFRDFVQRFPSSDLADNAQYGIGECFFAQAMFDSAAAEYAEVTTSYPSGDRVPAAMYKLALSQEKLKQTAESKKTLADLVQKYPLSGEAQLARERLGTSRKH